MKNGEKVISFAENLGDLEILKISSDSKWIATRHEDKILRVWDLDKLLQENTAVDAFVEY
jgi:hypothetical protein